MTDFPPNSDKSKQPTEKEVPLIANAEPIRRDKPLGRRLRDTFIAGDIKTAASTAAIVVLVPALKEAFTDALSTGFERLIYGESRGGGRRRPPGSPQREGNYVTYNRMSRDPQPTPRDRASRISREAFEFQDLILADRNAADSAIQGMFDLLEKYDSVSVADLYTMLGVKTEYTDQKWGWRSLRGANVTKVRQGYLLDLPDPEPFA